MTTNKIKILTFSGRMRSGKDMLCHAMETAYGAKTFSLATHLKQLCCNVLDIELPMLSPWDRTKLDMWKNNRGVLIEEGLELCEQSIKVISDYTRFGFEPVKQICSGTFFRSVRELLQMVGTDVIRSIDASWHIKKTLQDIRSLPEKSIACVDDIRFPNELEAFRKSGAETFFIIRTNAENISSHLSENSLSHINFPDDMVVINNGSLETLCNEFVNKYTNGFDMVREKPILLSEYPEYQKTKRDFGTELTPIVEEVIRQNKERDIFLKDGLITFRNNTKFNLKELLEEMGIEQTYTHRQIGGRFVIDNPVAYENLKRWL
jgi:hypothetical protein